VRTGSAATLRTLLAGHTTLYDAAAKQPDAQPITGRGIAWAIQPGGEYWLVRHYRRGGVAASMLNDRYASFGGDRALHELNVSTRARARGIPTPPVVAALSYPGPLFSRFDIAVEFIDRARDLAQLLFEDRIVSVDDIARAAQAIRTSVSKGLVHPDLNLKNVLVTQAGAWILDLDRCTLADAATQSAASHMRQRFKRSLSKWESQTGRVVSDEHHRTLEAAFDV
jgi:aminoglycoside phosphotransferase (APT) family kinase protein